jgi:hypothetical protein
MYGRARSSIVTPSKQPPASKKELTMMKRIRIALVALLIAFAIAFSANHLAIQTGFLAGSGTVKPTAGSKPPKGVVLGLASIQGGGFELAPITIKRP